MFSLKPQRIPSLDLEKTLKNPNNEKVAIDDSNLSKRSGKKKLLLPVFVAFVYLCLTSSCLSRMSDFLEGFYQAKQVDSIDFYHNITRPQFACAMRDGSPTSFAGTIGLEGDSEETPKRSFFWYFEAENNPQDAPIVLTIGGGPGTTGLLNGVNGQSSCLITAPSTIEYNPNRWTEHFNLLALDYPTNVGYSYGARVNNSHDGAIDAYDFLQKFFRLFPQLQKNKLVISGGSYGGIYIPNIAYVINENNKAILDRSANRKNNLLIKLNSIMLSNPITDPFIYHSWLLEYRCTMHQVYNSTMCNAMFSNLPKCLESIQLAYQFSNVYYRSLALEVCYKYNATTDVVLEDVRRKCERTDDPTSCHPFLRWMDDFFKNETTKDVLGLARDRKYTALNMDVLIDFWRYGDQMQPHQDLLIPVMNDGIRVLFYIGAQDANCPWPGVLSSLKQLQGPYQDAFLSTPDVPWDSGLNQTVTVRQVGNGAGDFTYMLIDQAGHFVVHDQPKLAKVIAEHWIRDIPFANVSDANAGY